MDVGAIINKQYNVIEHIGRGGMADVWSAKDNRLRRMVAIKTIAVGLSPDIDPMQLFSKEAQTIAQMEHPHILPIYDFGEHEGNLYIVMRLVTGGSLEDLLEKNPLSLDETLRIGNAIAEALDYAHANKIIHLDLKPPNILMDSSRSPYLADFGLATVLDKEGRARNPGSGTLLYMAPEQLTSEMIDHRADLYSFCIMLYHMLTGRLPFDGTVPLALRQLQNGEEMPEISELPTEVTETLRKGTHRDPERRYTRLIEIMRELQAVLQPSALSVTVAKASDKIDLSTLESLTMETERLIKLGDNDLLEAVDLYTRARYNWAGGQGRFIVSLTHFMLMSGYYQESHFYGLDIDATGYQMLLRGALEHDYEMAYWWERCHDEQRRWVCLHTLRTGSTPARIRALYRLETLPDDEHSPVIPKLVAQALEIEADTTARLAALQVLGTRTRLMKPTMRYQIQSQFRGRLLSSMTRLGIEIQPQAEWNEGVYSPEIDLMVAEQALDTSTPVVAEAASRTIGKMHSLTAVRFLANEQRNKRTGALQALAFVRDETPNLPDVVSRQARLYAWLTNTIRRLTSNPLDSILRFTLALLGGWIAFGAHIYSTYFSQSLFTPQRWGNTIAAGLVMGVFVGIVVLVTDEFSRRLRGFWVWWLRLLFSGVLGVLVGMLAWGGIRWFYFSKIPGWDLMRTGGAGLALGFVFVAVLNVRGWRALFLPALLTFLPILASFPNYCLQDYFCIQPDGSLWLPAFNYFPFAGVGLLIGAYVGNLIPHSKFVTDAPLVHLPTRTKTALSLALGVAWAGVIWHGYVTIYSQNFITWDHINLWYYGSMILSVVLVFLMQRIQSLAFLLGALVPFVIVGVMSTQAIFGTLEVLGVDHYVPSAFVAPQKELGENGVRDTLLTYRFPDQVLTLGIPLALVIALGAYVQTTYQGIASWIGNAKARHAPRDGWLTGMLLYALFMGGLFAVLSLFQAHADLIWGVGWSAWGFAVFVCAMAVWRWARWGGYGLVTLGMLLVAGGFAYDALLARTISQEGGFPALFEAGSVVFWLAWTLLIGLGAWGALRRQLWGGLLLVSLIGLWYVVALFGVVPASMTVQAIANLAFMAFALAPVWLELEASRFRLPRIAFASVPVAPTPVVAPTPETVVREQPVTKPIVDELSELPVAINVQRAPALAVSYNLHTEQEPLDVPIPQANASVPSPELKTEFDINTPAPAPSDLKTSLDAGKPPANLSRPASRMKIDLGAIKKTSKSDEGAPKTQATPRPSLKIQLGSKPKSATKPDLKTEIDPQGGEEKPKTPSRPVIKIQTGLLKPEEPPAPDLRTKVDYQPEDDNKEED